MAANCLTTCHARGNVSKESLSECVRTAGFIVYREMNVAIASNRLGWIESDLSVWNSCSAAVGAMVCPFLDIRRDYRVVIAWRGEG
jgi:hypothetical protein